MAAAGAGKDNTTSNRYGPLMVMITWRAGLLRVDMTEVILSRGGCSVPLPFAV
jgi:hypothetical protein